MKRTVAYLLSIVFMASCETPEYTEPSFGPMFGSSVHAELGGSGFSVSPAIGWPDTGVTATPSQDGVVSWCCTGWSTPLHATSGTTIGSLMVPVRDNGAANGFPTDGNNVIIMLVSQTASGCTTPPCSTSLGIVTSNGSGSPQALTLTLATPHTVVAGELLIVRALALAGGAVPGPALHPSLVGTIQVGTVQPAVPAVRVVRFRPQWLQQGPFVISPNPVPGSTNPPVWKSTGTFPAAASFEIPFQAGDTITGLGWDAYGDGGAGLGSIDVIYQSTMGGGSAQPVGTFDMHRAPGWSRFTASGFTPQLLGEGGFLWVFLEVEAPNYYIGDITATFTR